MDRAGTVETLLESLADSSPSGYAIALHVTFTTPRFLFQSYPKDWMDEYSRKGLVLHDPTVRWGLENDGAVHWTDLKEADAAGVLDTASTFGLNYGLTIATSEGGTKSIGSFARPDEEFDEADTQRLAKIVEDLHEATAGVGADDSETLAKLKRLSVRNTHG